MIDIIREKLKSKHNQVAVWIFIVIVIIGLGFPGTFGRMGKSGSWVAVINGKQLSTHELGLKQQEQRIMINAIKSMYPQYADMFLRMYGLDGNVEDLALQALINEELLDQFIATLGIELSSRYIEDNAARVAPGMVLDRNGAINAHAVAEYAREVGMSVAEFDARLEQALKRRFGLEVAATASYIPSFELKQQYAAKKLKKKFATLSFSLDSFIKREQAKTISDAEIKAFFDQENKRSQRYWVPEKRSGSAWSFDRAKFGVTVPDKAIETYYDRHKTEKYQEAPVQLQVRTLTLKVPSVDKEQEMHQQAQQLAEQLKKEPTTFEAVAKKQSQDSAKGAASEWFAKGKHESSFDSKAFLLQNDGDVSDPVKTTDGWVIIQRVGRKAATYKPLSSVKKDIVKELEPRFFAEQFNQEARSLVAKSDAQGLNAFVSKHSGSHQALNNVELGSSAEAGLLGKAKVGGYAYQVVGDKGILVRLDAIAERNLPGFDSIKETVRQDYITDRAYRAMQDLGKEIQDFAQGKKIEEIQEKFKGKLEKTDWVNPADSSAIEGLRKKGFPIDDALSLSKVGAIALGQGKDTAYVILLEKIDAFDPAAFEKEQKALLNEAKREQESIEQAGLIASLRRNAILNLNDSIISRKKDRDHARKNNSQR